MKKILLFLFLIPLFVSCENEYIRFHTEKQQLETAIVSAEREAQHFTLDSVAKKDFEIQSTPSLETLNAIISAIDQAKKRVYLEVYIFTEKRLEDALKKAKLR
jgi:phosphatidylserine/phosphatidylglycerophosphate/cardiolipin synthase-like enzyme